MPRSGFYLIIAKASTSTAPGSVNLRVNKNSGTFILIPAKASAAVANAVVISSDIVLLEAGDTLTLEVMEDNATGSLTVNALLVVHWMSDNSL